MASFESVFLVVVLCIGVMSCQDLRPKRDTEPKNLLQDGKILQESEYDQEIPQSHTADQPTASGGSHMPAAT